MVKTRKTDDAGSDKSNKRQVPERKRDQERAASQRFDNKKNHEATTNKNDIAQLLTEIEHAKSIVARKDQEIANHQSTFHDYSPQMNYPGTSQNQQHYYSQATQP